MKYNDKKCIKKKRKRNLIIYVFAKLNVKIIYPPP